MINSKIKMIVTSVFNQAQIKMRFSIYYKEITYSDSTIYKIL